MPITDQLAGFDDYIESEIAAYNVPGLSAAIIYEGEVVHMKGYGLRNIAENLPVTPETLFAMASCTKAFTAMSAAMLVEEGKLDWDTPVRHYLPWFKLYDPVTTEQVTPRDLACHRTGVPRHDYVRYGSPLSRREIVEHLRYVQPNKPLRYLYQYNNLMIVTLGYLVGEIAGMSWEAFVKQRILDKLGMSFTQFSVTDSQKSSDAALPYSLEKNLDEVLLPSLRAKRSGEGSGEGFIKAIPFRNLDNGAPAGAINSNLVDMMKWLKIHMSGGKYAGGQLIREDLLKEMHTHQMVMPLVPDMPGYGYDEIQRVSYALGWRVQTYRGRQMVWHTGGIDGFTSMTSFIPGHNMGVVVLNNMNHSNLPITVTLNIYDRLFGLDVIPWSKRIKEKEDGFARNAKAALEKRAAARKPNAPTTHPLDDYVGDYWHPGYETLTISRDGDSLNATHNGWIYALKHYHYDIFEATNSDIEFSVLAPFIMDNAGKVSEFRLQLEPLVDPIIFKRKS